MPFTIPNEAAAAFPALARVFQSDVDALVAGYSSTGVVSGCAVTAQGAPNMTLAVAAGTIVSGGATASVSAGNVTITAAHATLERVDLVVASSSGVKSVQAGTAAATPVTAAIPAGSVLLATVVVPAADTAIGSTQLRDGRVVIAAGTPDHAATHADGGSDEVTISVNQISDLAGIAVLSGDIRTIVVLTQTEYDALSPPVATTLYLIEA